MGQLNIATFAVFIRPSSSEVFSGFLCFNIISTLIVVGWKFFTASKLTNQPFEPLQSLFSLLSTHLWVNSMWICVETVSTCMRDAINLCRGNNCWSFHIKLQSFFPIQFNFFFFYVVWRCGGSFMCAWNFKAFFPDHKNRKNLSRTMWITDLFSDSTDDVFTHHDEQVRNCHKFVASQSTRSLGKIGPKDESVFHIKAHRVVLIVILEIVLFLPLAWRFPFNECVMRE